MNTPANDYPSLISNDLLRALATPNYDACLGEFDAETRATLAVALPEIAAELLARRGTGAIRCRNPPIPPQRPTAQIIAFPLKAILRVPPSLAHARLALASPYQIHLATLAAACRVLMTLSPDATERTAAAEVLAEMSHSADRPSGDAA